MNVKSGYDAVVVGSGPNGLSAAIAIARTGRTVVVIEANESLGGGARSMALTLPGFTHDICSAVHPLGIASPFFSTLPLGDHGLAWIEPPVPMAHPFDDGTAATLHHSIDETAESLGAQDGKAYKSLIAPIARNFSDLLKDSLAPAHLPAHPLLFLQFGLSAVKSVKNLARGTFHGKRGRALIAGVASHSTLPLDSPLTASFGLILAASAHTTGWPIARHGSQRISDALAAYLNSYGGDIITGQRIGSIRELPRSGAVLFDLTPKQILQIAGDRFPESYFRRLAGYRYGPGSFKVDYALSGPVPWIAEECRAAGTVHIGGTLEEIAESEATVWRGRHPERPYVIVAQQSLFDSSRAPEGKHTLWAYCHVPNGSAFDMTQRIENQIERFAPGFRELILGRNSLSPLGLEMHNANYVGGDINGGLQDLHQFFTRPIPSLDPYSTPAKGIYICSSSTPPGGGVHGMCGYYAAKSALRTLS